MALLSSVAMTGLEKFCITSAYLQSLCHIGERPVALLFFYTPDIRSMWGYIVFAFPFVCWSVRSFVRTYVRSCVRSSFRHRVKVFALKFIRPFDGFHSYLA